MPPPAPPCPSCVRPRRPGWSRWWRGGQLAALLLVLAVLLLLGVGTRVVAFGAAIALTLLLERDPRRWCWAPSCSRSLALLGGGGRAQLWNVEERWMLSRAGSQDSHPESGP